MDSLNKIFYSLGSAASLFLFLVSYHGLVGGVFTLWGLATLEKEILHQPLPTLNPGVHGRWIGHFLSVSFL